MGSRRLPVTLTLVVATALGLAVSGAATGRASHFGPDNRAASLGSAGWLGDQAVLSSRPETELLGMGTVSARGVRVVLRVAGSRRPGDRRGRRHDRSDDDRPGTEVLSGLVRPRSPPG
jgi:hypothetical protein